MTKWRHFIASLILVSAMAGAGDGEPAKGGLLVDLDAAVESGKVEPVDGLSTAGQPNEAGFKVFADNGYAAVIDLRTEGEDRGLDEAAVVEDLGMEYVSLPIGGGDITFEKAAELKRLMDQYDEPILLHCGSSSRVGALLALQEYAATGDRDAALEAGRAAGLTRLETKVIDAIDANKKGQ
ncbi:MAG: sulfur transferase domain-containing protein [Woeseiaceae bacterium]|nr:sulfur transferase domain-containing protein [Woeseiaceae bacterium]